MSDPADVEALVARLATIDFSQTSEQATREMAVNPVIGALGWDTFNPGEVAREHPVRGGKVDYCLRGPMGALVLIEVKRTGTELSEHQEQLLRYAFDEGVLLAALTDGLIWWLYLPTAPGSWEQRRFSRIAFREQDATAAASAMQRFLGREGLVGGTALDEARREFESQERDRRVRAALQLAWKRVLDDPQSLLHDLLAETVKEISGHLPDRETVKEFLRGVSGGGSVASESPPSPPTTPASPPPRRGRAAQQASTTAPQPDAVMKPDKKVRRVHDTDGLAGAQAAYRDFWSGFLPAFHLQHPGWSRARTPSRDSSMSFPAGKARVHYAVSFCRTEGRYRFRCELYIDANAAVEADRRFGELRARDTEIETAFGDTLEWEILSNSRGSRIASYYPEDVRVRDRERWGALRAWAINRIGVFRQALQPHIDALP